LNELVAPVPLVTPHAANVAAAAKTKPVTNRLPTFIGHQRRSRVLVPAV
jgi:hypothetical protein